MATTEDMLAIAARIDLARVDWLPVRSSPAFDYPIDYSVAVVEAHPEAGEIAFLLKWAPDAYCHFHRHMGATSSLVLAGTHHIVDEGTTETVHRTRTRGHAAHSPAGDVHMEYGGPDGAVVLFAMKSEDGRLFDVLDAQRQVLSTATIEDFVTGQIAR